MLDAMGGDIGLSVNLEGALMASRSFSQEDTIILTGVRSEIEKMIKDKRMSFGCKIEIIDAANNVGMGDSPTKALQEKPESSIAKGLDLVKSKRADAFFSPGNTGVILAFSLVKLGRLRGVNRPALGVIFPVGRHPLMLDVGATPDYKPENLYQFALLGHEYMKIMRDNDKPVVGLLSIGEENSKGSVPYQRAFDLIKQDKEINFLGNIEGDDFFKDKVDVIVTDGFTGNILLKFAEGMVHWFKVSFKTSVKPLPIAILGVILSFPGFLGIPFFLVSIKKLLKKVSYDEIGGAPLLGVDGVVLIGHGKSNPKAVRSGILNAKKLVEHNFIGELKGIFENRRTSETD
ncbi:MAG: phosphate acyltransferase PlsX [bacterium]|nr:phosphate acyltransferase PlsX [bacterium]